MTTTDHTFLVLSNQHHLLPFAHRLRLEGHSVEPVVWRGGRDGRYEHAWQGLFEMPVRPSLGGTSKKAIEPAVEAARRDDTLVVITDSYHAARQFEGAQKMFPAIKPTRPPEGPVRLGGWFDGEQIDAPHLLVLDLGTWPGGLGPRDPGGLTLVRIDETAALDIYFHLMGALVEEMKSSGFRGLFQVGLRLDTADGDPKLEGAHLGWPGLQTHAFLSELENFGDVLLGAVPTIRYKYTVVAPVTVPPWPSLPGGKELPKLAVEGLTPAQQGRVFWHDIQADPEERQITTAGLDGLVGVVRGEADRFELAQSRVINVAGAIQLPQLQWRPDVGRAVPMVLAALEGEAGILV